MCKQKLWVRSCRFSISKGQDLRRPCFAYMCESYQNKRDRLVLESAISKILKIKFG